MLVAKPRKNISAICALETRNKFHVMIKKNRMPFYFCRLSTMTCIFSTTLPTPGSRQDCVARMNKKCVFVFETCSDQIFWFSSTVFFVQNVLLNFQYHSCFAEILSTTKKILHFIHFSSELLCIPKFLASTN